MIKDRVLEHIAVLGISKNKFYKLTGIPNGTLDKNTGVSEMFIEKYISIFPQVNPLWLLTGRGKMLQSGEIQTSHVTSSGEEHIVTIPLYNAEASAGIGALRLSNEYIIDNLQVPFARENDIALTIVGDSMTPAMQSGDIAVVRSMQNWREYLDYGNIFIVVTDSEVYCKTVSKSTEKDIFTLKSYNTNYGDFDIPKKYISEIYKVIGIISQRSY